MCLLCLVSISNCKSITGNNRYSYIVLFSQKTDLITQIDFRLLLGLVLQLLLGLVVLINIAVRQADL